jgi:hypothetical protein
MVERSTIEVTIAFIDPGLDIEEREEEVYKLISQMEELDEVEKVDRVLDPNPPADNKALGGFLMGLLMAEVSPTNGKKLLSFLGDRLSGKPMEMNVKRPDGKELTIKASSEAEFEFTMKKAQKFLQSA